MAAEIGNLFRDYSLQGGQIENRRWDAIEAIRGAPLGEVAAGLRGLTWQDARALLLDLVLELTASLEDGTLPSRLSLDPSSVS